MTPPSESDLLLTQRIRAGEAGGWSELIAASRGRLWPSSRAGYGAAVAEDVVQETFIGS